MTELTAATEIGRGGGGDSIPSARFVGFLCVFASTQDLLSVFVLSSRNWIPRGSIVQVFFFFQVFAVFKSCFTFCCIFIAKYMEIHARIVAMCLKGPLVQGVLLPPPSESFKHRRALAQRSSSQRPT